MVVSVIYYSDLYHFIADVNYYQLKTRMLHSVQTTNLTYGGKKWDTQ